MTVLTFRGTTPRQFDASDGSPALRLRTGDDGIPFAADLWSDFREEPLTLKAGNAGEGTEFTLVLRPWRIELWADGFLADEEWPAGELRVLRPEVLSALGEAGIAAREASDADAREWISPDFRTDCGTSANEEEDCVPFARAEEGGEGRILGRLISREGENAAEGWRPSDPGVFVGDCMPYADPEGDPAGDGRYHVLYLKDRRNHRSKWGRGAHQWAHLSTADFKNWDFHPLTVSIDAPGDGSICTGSRLKTADGRSLLYYTIRQINGEPAPVKRSVSADGYRYRRDDGFTLFLSGRYHGPSARDPKIVAWADGFHMFVTTSLTEEGPLCGRGCLAHLYSPDGENWEERGPVYVSETEDQPECPDWFALGGWHYLIFSLRGRGHYLMSREPFGGWREPPDPVIPCSSVPKMALWQGRILFAGFRSLGGYAGVLTFREAWQNSDGTLRFE